VDKIWITKKYGREEKMGGGAAEQTYRYSLTIFTAASQGTSCVKREGT
jgi:hypothetical protein